MKIIIGSLFVLQSLCSGLYSSSTDDIQSKIREELDALPANTEIGILVYNPLTEDTIISVNHTRSMIPASNTKLFTTAVALKIMGGEYMLSTKILADRSSIRDSVLDGNIYIKGFGNSTFTSEDLDSLVTELKKTGLREIKGNVVGDDSFFDNVYTRDDWIRDEDANVKLPPISALVVDRNTMHVRRKHRGRWRTYRIYVENPPQHIANLFKSKLVTGGIKVSGNSVSGQTPENASLLFESTIKLNDLIKQINKNSDNFEAEGLFKTIGAIASVEQGNSFYATQTILSFIDDNGIYSNGTSIVDGSGISRNDQITVGAIVGLLEVMYFDLKHFPAFYNSLSIAGIDGTLEDRFNNTNGKINFRGKTGTLKGVSSLSGYLTTKAGDDLIISMIFEFENGRSKSYQDTQDRIIKILNDWKEESPGDINIQGY
ncbi:MAG: D-alanyl-D-alanine carboxypeptidase/D-alanyl-D-alanine-endopeptidase [Ignavibacteria bacterium]|jgi:D-alanyl-D-alanine carboxypeptidase/D-alanyl-D-alanine-endopeptidase (penicillin-binding protein 4)